MGKLCVGSLILVHFMKENHPKHLCGSWNPYPSAFYEGELGAEALQQLEILILVHFMKENYPDKLCGSWNPYPSAFYERKPPGQALQELKSLS